MKIEKVIDQGEQYLVNDSISVPKANDNTDYKNIQIWLGEGNSLSTKPDSEILAETKAEKIGECKAYLDLTDKWSIRLSETSVAMPSGVAANRANARAYQSQIEACTTLEQLNNINTDF